MKQSWMILMYLLAFQLPVYAAINGQQAALSQCTNSIKKGDIKSSRQRCKSNLSQIDRQQYPIITAKLELALYDINLELGDDSAAADYLASIKQGQGFQSSQEIQYLWLRKQGTQRLYKKDYQQAKAFYQQAFDIATVQASDRWLGKSYNDLALVAQYSNDYAKALTLYQQSLSIKEKLGNDFHTAITLNNLGLIYKKLEKFSESQRYFELSLEHYLAYTSTHFDVNVIGYMAHLYGNLAEIYNINNDFHKKYYYSNKVIAAYNESLTGNDRLSALINLATIHINAEEFEPAQEVIQTLSEYLDAKNHSFHDVIYHLKAQVAAHSKQMKQAIEDIESAMDYSDDKQDSLQKMNIYHYASELYHDNGRPYEAIIYLKKYQALHEALLDKKYSESIKVIQTDIDNERMQRALAEEQVINNSKSQEIDALVRLSLIIVSISLVIGFAVAFYIYKKRKAQQHLMTIIESHKQQLFLLSNGDATQDADDFEIDEEQAKEDGLSTKVELEVEERATTTELQSFAELLVETMLDCINIWEKTTQTNKVELADRSQIWKISIDSGRLRTRSLDKYLSMKKLPDNPRWRNVVKTCHFILSECHLSSHDRRLLTTHLNRIMQAVKAESMQQ